MLTNEQIEEIDSRLRRGDLPEEIGREMGLAPGAFRYQLLQSGRRIAIYRKLESTAPVAAEETILVH